MDMKKAEYYKISLKDTKLVTELHTINLWLYCVFIM